MLPLTFPRLNVALASNPYRGLIVVCPFLPDVFHGDQTMSDGARYASFIVDEVLPRVYRETPALGTPETTSIDGVSLGGRAALLVGLLRPKAFHVVAALQPALDGAEARPFAGLVERARKENPGLVVRLLSSDQDYFLEPTVELSRELKSRGVKHQLDLVVGNHSYEFNRGPGVYEMLIFHDRAVRGLDGI
jgi:enterochelin esterase-like enzyme